MKNPIILILAFLLFSAAALAQTQSHPLTQIIVNTNLNMTNATVAHNITGINYLFYSGGIFYAGTQGIPTADIANSSVTGSKIASNAITASKFSNPLGGSVNASVYYDQENSSYFLDPANTGTALAVAGSVGIGTTAPAGLLHVEKDGGAGYIYLSTAQNAAGGSMIFQRQARGTIASKSIVQSGDELGGMILTAWDGGAYREVVVIQGFVDGTPGASDMPGRLVFKTTADGAASPTERVRIDSSGNVGIGTTSPGQKLDVAGSGNVIAEVNSSNATAAVDLVAGRTYRLQSQAGGNFHISDENAGAYRLTINSTGNVGIGTTSPDRALDIEKNDGAGNTLMRLTPPAGGGTSGWDIAGTGTGSGWGAGNFVIDAAGYGNKLRMVYNAISLITDSVKLDVGGEAHGTKFVDRDNTAYYLDPASTGTSLNVAGSGTFANGLTVSAGTVSLPANQIDSTEVSFNYAGSASKGGAASDVACTNCVTLGTETSGSYDTTDDAWSGSSISGAVSVATGNPTGCDLTIADDGCFADPQDGYINWRNTANTAYGNMRFGNVQGAIYYDVDNTGFYLDPASTSILNDIRPSIVYDRDNTAYYLDPASTGTALAVAGQVKITGGTPGSGKVLTSDASGLASWQAAAGIPSGAIIMWAGTLANIPSGWQLCDGTGGTPDLRDKFIYGTSAGENPGATGGSTSHTHTMDPPLTTSSGPRSGTLGWQVYSASWEDPHNHAHTVDIPEFTSGSASNLPPYYKLAFICKL